MAEPGQNVVVTVGPQAVFILARSNSMLARGNLSVTQAKGLNIGRPLDVVFNNRVYAGKIANIVYEPNKDSVLVEAAFSAGEAFPSGMPATLRVP